VQDNPGGLRHDRVVWVVDDRREGAVDVAEDRRPPGVGAQWLEDRVGVGHWAKLVSLRMQRDRLVKLAAIGTAAGAFSGMFGVGGGTVIVPLLVLWFGFGERLATGTSLMAIVVIGALAAAGQGLHGNVDILEAILIGIPAIGGVVVGTGLQQRVPERMISLLFAVLLVAIALELIIP
jgi:uncharacterized protein